MTNFSNPLSMALSALKKEVSSLERQVYSAPPSDWSGYMERRGRWKAYHHAVKIIENCIHGKDYKEDEE